MRVIDQLHEGICEVTVEVLWILSALRKDHMDSRNIGL